MSFHSLPNLMAVGVFSISGAEVSDWSHSNGSCLCTGIGMTWFSFFIFFELCFIISLSSLLYPLFWESQRKMSLYIRSWKP